MLGGKLEGAELQVKDLGPQISWKTVFLIEYVSSRLPDAMGISNALQVGPLIIHPLVYYFPKFWYRRDVQHSSLQKCVSSKCDPLYFAEG